MQKLIPFLFILFSCLILKSAVAQGLEHKIMAADSLFSKKKFMESQRIFRNMLEKEAYYTLPMLLKSAYIAENSGDYPEALYYLSLYYANKPDQLVLNKIVDISDKHKLEGFKPSDSEYALYLMRQYHPFLIAVVAFITFLVVIYLFRLWWRKKDILFPCLLLNVLLAIFFYFYNYGYNFRKGIVKNDKIFMMNAPSAGGKLLNAINKGNCLNIIGQEDIWCRVEWNGKEGFVRYTNLYLID